MSAAHLPLAIEWCSGEDSEAYMSKGHHHFAAFLKAAKEYMGEEPKGFEGPMHDWWRCVPVPPSGDRKFEYHRAEAGTRGAFPVTVISRH